jgi:hypothetical protein
MKRYLVFAGALLALHGSALAVEFNPDAAKAMQKSAVAAFEQSKNLKLLKTPSGKCLHAAGNFREDNANLLLQNCDGSYNQKWRLDEHGGIVNAAFQCATMQGAPGQAGANVVTGRCQGRPNQIWRMDPQSRLVTQGGKCLTVAGDINAPGVNVVIADCAGGPNQKWRFE